MTLYSSHLEPYIARALQNLLEGQMPCQSDLEHLTGDVRASLTAMQDALREDGLQAVQKVFKTLLVDRPWLGRLASMQPPNEPLPDLPPRRVRFLSDSEFENRPPRQWLIPAIMPREGTAMVFGPSGCNKSFLVMAWSLCIASGTPWLGRQVLQGPVAYISAEGSFGIGARIKAWKTFHQFSGESGVKWFDETVVLQDAGNFKELRMALEEDFAQPPLLVVIDTLSRCSGGADENSNTEMARIIAATDILHQTYHCTVLIVHHAGKDNERGAWAASVLRQSEAVMLALLSNAEQPLTYGEWVKAGVEAGLKERTAERSVNILVNTQQVQKEGRRYILASEAEGRD